MATMLLPAECVINLPGGWIDPWGFERLFSRSGDALGGPSRSVVVRISSRCKLMADVIIRLLSFCNQVVALTKQMRIEFLDGGNELIGYLNRMGFFDFLSPAVEVYPTRPFYSGAALHRGGNASLVEIERFSGTSPAHHGLSNKLATAARNSCAKRNDVDRIYGSVFTIFSELIGNVSEHSQSPLDAFAVLQTYKAGNKVRIAVSDSGIGMLDSLRPALVRKGDPAASLSDVDLLVAMFREGISRLDEENRGNGLMASAAHAIRFGADLDIRLPHQQVLLRPANSQYESNLAYTIDGLSLLKGTHISFALNLT